MPRDPALTRLLAVYGAAFERLLGPYLEIVFCDTEYFAPAGHRPRVICLVCYLWRAQRLIRLWLWDTVPPTHPPFPIDRYTLFVTHNATAELSAFHVLNWAPPAHILDTYVEARCAYNGRWASFKLGDVARHLGIAFQSKEEKESNQDLAIRGGPYTAEERQRLLDYCQEDTLVLPKILMKLSPQIALPYYLFRGKYMKALSVVEHRGLPIDRPGYDLLRAHKEALFSRLQARTERAIGPLWEGDTFSQKRLRQRLVEWGIDTWPTTPTGLLSTRDKVLELMGRRYPQVEYLRQTQKMLRAFRLFDFAIGDDGCNRFSHIGFRTVTGRNAPSTKASLFQAAKCFRFLAKPFPGHGLAYIDWDQQEFMIHAVLARDHEGLQAYRSGDPYMAIAIATGLAPPWARKDTHPRIRDLFKVVVLAMSYGAGAQTLATATGLPYWQAEDLLARFHHRFEAMHAFDQKVLHLASVSGRQRTRLQWHRQIRQIIPGAGEDKTPGVATRESVRNFPVQSNAAEMFRWAVVYAVEARLPVVLLMHDAVMVHAPLDDLDEVIQETRACMAKASRLILQGEELRTSVETITTYPDRYRDPKGAPLWQAICEEMRQLTGVDLDPLSPESSDVPTMGPSVVRS